MSKKSLEVLVDTQVDYLLPSRPTYIDGGHRIIVPGFERLCALMPETSHGVLFTGNKFTVDQYAESRLSQEFPPHCLVGALGDYDPVGVQNIFNQRLLVSRGIPTYHLHKQEQDMWDLDSYDMHATVHAYQGSNATAYTLPEFIGKYVLDAGISHINIWGVSADAAVREAITGFLARKFKVNVITNLCKSRGADIEDVLEDLFAEEMASGMLTMSLAVDTIP